MTNKPREFWIYIGEIDDIVFTKPTHLKNQDKYIHVIEAGPVLEKIRRLEDALEQCREQRRDAINQDGRSLHWDEIDKLEEKYEKELESILEGK